MVKKILVTGGMGYIGSHTEEELLPHDEIIRLVFFELFSFTILLFTPVFSFNPL